MIHAAVPASRKMRPFILFGVALLIITKIVALTPSPLEEVRPAGKTVDAGIFIQNKEPTLAPGIPVDRVAEYSVDKFGYVSVQNGEKLWKIDAFKAYMYNPERLVHARKVKAYLYDPEGKVTVITGQEAKYFLNQKDLEVYGDVETIFPDGFKIYSEYLRYKPNERRVIMPTSYHVRGSGVESDGQDFSFESQGLDYLMASSLITLPQNAKVTLERPTSPTASPTPLQDAPGVPDRTVIESDFCLIDRANHLAKFTMYATRPLKESFVHITQPTLFSRSRRADLTYGNFSNVLHYLIAYDDVLIKEIEEKNKKKPPSQKKNEKKTLRYATSGRADFDTQTDLIILTRFPQVYQNADTVTGDVILMHRDTDVVEIEHSNAFSQGENE